MWLLTATNFETGPDTEKPAVWVDGNIHASEVAASAAVLYHLHTLVTRYGKDADVTRALDTRAFYLVPRVNPDGAEWALASEHPFQPNDVPAGLYARYTSIIQNFVAGPEYRVVPYAQEGSGRSYGEPGNICRTLAADRCWATGRGNNNRDGRCAALGPDAAVHAWSLPLPGATMAGETLLEACTAWPTLSTP